MNRPNDALMELYGTDDIFKEKVAGMPAFSGRIATSLLSRTMLMNRRLAEERHRQEAASMNAQFRMIEHEMMRPELQSLEHSHVPMFVPPGSDLPAGWDEGMVRLASIAADVGRDMAKLAFGAPTGGLPKIQTKGVSAPPIGASPARTPSLMPTNFGGKPTPQPARSATPPPTNVIPGGAKPLGVPAAPAQAPGGRVPTPTQAGVAEVHHAFKNLDPGLKDVILKHPMVAGGHMSPEAAFQLANMSIPKNVSSITPQGLEHVMAAGRNVAPKGAPALPPKQQTINQAPHPSAFQPPAQAAPAPAAPPARGPVRVQAENPSAGRPASAQPAPAAQQRPITVAGQAVPAMGAGGAPPAQGPFRAPAQMPPAPPSGGAPPSAPAATPAPAAPGGPSFLQQHLGKNWVRNGAMLGAAGAGLYGASRLAGAAADWSGQEAGPQTYTPPGMYQVPMGVNQYGQPQPGSPLY